jgi:hypothetical protein
VQWPDPAAPVTASGVPDSAVTVTSSRITTGGSLATRLRRTNSSIGRLQGHELHVAWRWWPGAVVPGQVQFGTDVDGSPAGGDEIGPKSRLANAARGSCFPYLKGASRGTAVESRQLVVLSVECRAGFCIQVLRSATYRSQRGLRARRQDRSPECPNLRLRQFLTEWAARCGPPSADAADGPGALRVQLGRVRRPALPPVGGRTGQGRAPCLHGCSAGPWLRR